MGCSSVVKQINPIFCTHPFFWLTWSRDAINRVSTNEAFCMALIRLTLNLYSLSCLLAYTLNDGGINYHYQNIS